MTKHIFLILLILTTTAQADTLRIKKHHATKPEQTAINPDQAALTAAAMPNIMQSLSMDQVGGLAGCLEQYFKSQGIPTPDPGPDATAQAAWAQEFMASPTGQAAIAACQGQIQTLLPLVQQNLQTSPAGNSPLGSTLPASPQH